MDAHLHSHAIRSENAHRMAAAHRTQRLHADRLGPEVGPRLHRRLMARLRMQPLPRFTPAPSTGIVVVA